MTSQQAVDEIIVRLRIYRDGQKVRTDVLEALRNFPSLQPRSGVLARQPPSQNSIMFLSGTVPIFYNKAQYNIPVNIWITEHYPFQPPICYVTPTPEMIIKPKHKHVDSAGMIYMPYLSSWNPTASNLTQLIVIMSKTFGEDPPLRSQATPQPTPQPPPSNYPNPNNYGQPPNKYPPQPQPQPQPAYGQPTQPYPQNPTPPQGPPPPYGQQQQQQPFQSGPSYSSGVIPPYQANNSASSQYNPQNPPSNQPFEDPAVVAKRNAARNATEKVQAKLQDFYSKTTKEIDELMAKNAVAEDKSRVLELEKQQLTAQLSQTDGDIDTLTKSFEDITKWLEENDASSKIDIDAITEPKDASSKQLLYLVAEDATIEDTLYYLEKNLMNGELNLESFLKNVRSLSTEQFLKRATIKKIHERQRQLQSQPMK